MNVTQKLVALAMERTEAKSQAELAVKTGLSKQMVSFYVTGRSAIQKPEHIAALCLLANEDPQKWFASLALEATDRTDVRAWARKLGAAAAVAVVALIPFGNVSASTPTPEPTSAAMHITYELGKRACALLCPAPQ